jgi:hypothetical protein
VVLFFYDFENLFEAGMGNSIAAVIDLNSIELAGEHFPSSDLIQGRF